MNCSIIGLTDSDNDGLTEGSENKMLYTHSALSESIFCIDLRSIDGLNLLVYQIYTLNSNANWTSTFGILNQIFQKKTP